MNAVRYLLVPLLALALVLNACKKKGIEPPSTLKTIYSFSFQHFKNPSLQQDFKAVVSHDSIILSMPGSIPLDNLVPTISWGGVAINPSPDQARNFSQPVSYTVTAEDGTSKTYRVYINILSSAKAITSFIFEKNENLSLDSDIICQIIGDSILATVPPGTDVKNLIPTITYTGTSLSPAGGQSEDFTFPATYAVFAEDGSSRNYRVFVGSNLDVFISGNDDNLYAINCLTGAVHWKYPTGATATPTYHNGVVFAAGANNVVYAINASDGSLKWQSTPPAGNYSLTLPAVSNGKLFFAGAGDLPYPGTIYSHYAGFVYALDEETGNTAWFSTLFTGYDYTSSINTNVVADSAFACVYDIYNGLFVFHASDGTPAWGKVGDMLGRGNPIMRNSRILYTIERGLRSVDETTGNEYWHLINANNFGNPSGDDQAYYVSYDNLLLALNWDGSQKWQISLASRNFYSPAVGKDALYVSNAFQQVGAYRKTDGTLIWSLDNYDAFPVLANTRLFIVDMNGYLKCLDAASGNTIWSTNAHNFVANALCVADAGGRSYHIPESGETN